MTVTVIDTNNTDGAITVDTNATDHRSMMLASAASLVATTLDMEGKLSDTAKAWGASVFTLAYPADPSDKPVTLDTLIGDSKMAAGWATIGATDAGKKAKSRMEVYFSNARLVAESFDSLSDDDKRDIRNGLSSVHYRAGLIRKAASDAKKAAAKETARLEAEALAAASKAEADAPATASDDELNDAYEGMATLTAAYDARINAATETVAIAA
jgi:hypothetical protein